MGIISKSELQWHSISMLKARRDFSERHAAHAQNTVFLSHKHSDKTEVKFARDLLYSLGADVYIDWLDPDMPIKTRGETAIIIKEKIIKNNKFILLATDAAIESQWCNWELGYGDAQKLGSNKLTLFPLKEDNRHWSGNEYMQLYHTIEYENGNNKYSNGKTIPEGYYVFSPSKNGSRNLVSLKQWIES